VFFFVSLGSFEVGFSTTEGLGITGIVVSEEKRSIVTCFFSFEIDWVSCLICSSPLVLICSSFAIINGAGVGLSECFNKTDFS
jgi:hypothetical protein